MNFFKKHYGLFIIVLLSFFAIKPLLQPGFFPMHDDTQVARVYEMGKALRDGMFPVRWVNDLGYGYGYPIFNFYAPLAYYAGGFFVLFGINALLATKITMIIGIVLSGICMYFLARNFWGETGGVISGLFYIYATYHAVDIYVRGDVAEFWAYGFIPLVFLGVYKVYLVLKENSDKKEIWQGMIIGSLGYTGVILSHNLTAFMVTPFLIFFVIILFFATPNGRKLYAIRNTQYAIFLGLLLSAFYWLPVPFEIKYTNVFSQIGGGANYKDHFVCLFQYWYSPWGYGGSVPGCTDGLSFMLGKLHIIFTIVSLIGVFLLWRKNKNRAIVILLGVIGLISSLLLGTEYSSFIWRSIPFMTFLQYPWRFLVLASFFSSFLAGSIILIANQLNGRKEILYIITIGSITILLFLQTKFFVPKKIIAVNADYYTNKHVLMWNTSKISDEYMPQDFVKPKSEKEIRPGLAYFPAWHIYADNVQIHVRAAFGRIILPVIDGKHSYRIVYEETPIERLGDLLTMSGFAILFIGIIYSIVQNEKTHS